MAAYPYPPNFFDGRPPPAYGMAPDWQGGGTWFGPLPPAVHGPPPASAHPAAHPHRQRHVSFAPGSHPPHVSGRSWPGRSSLEDYRSARKGSKQQRGGSRRRGSTRKGATRPSKAPAAPHHTNTALVIAHGGVPPTGRALEHMDDELYEDYEEEFSDPEMEGIDPFGSNIGRFTTETLVQLLNEPDNRAEPEHASDRDNGADAEFDAYDMLPSSPQPATDCQEHVAQQGQSSSL